MNFVDNHISQVLRSVVFLVGWFVRSLTSGHWRTCRVNLGQVNTLLVATTGGLAEVAVHDAFSS